MNLRFPSVIAAAASLAVCQAPSSSASAPIALPIECFQEAPATAHKAFEETINLRVGGLAAAAFNTEASLGILDTQAGTRLDFESDLGLADTTESLRVDAFWRINRRNRIDVGYFDLQRSGSRTATREIEWGEATFPVSANLSSHLDTRIIPVRYTYSFVADDTLDIGVGLGVYFMQLSAGLSANSLGTSQSFESPVPLPVVAMHASWEFTPGWQLFGTVQAFYVDLQSVGKIDDLTGSIVDATLGLDYEVFEHASLGAAVNYFNMDVGLTTDQLDFDFGYDYTALFVFFSLKI